MKRGDREAIRILTRLFASATYARAFSKTGDLDRARRAVVQAFVSAFRRIPSLMDGDDFPAVLAREVGASTYTPAVSRAAGASFPDSFDGPGLLSGHHSLSGSAKLRAHRAAQEKVSALDPLDRATALLAFVQGLKSGEIASTTAEPEEEVRRSLARIALRLDTELRATGKELNHDFGLCPEPAEGWNTAACGRPIEPLVAYGEGALGGSEGTAAAEHLRGCAACRGTWERLQGAREVLVRQLQHYRLGETFPNEVLEALGALPAAPVPFQSYGNMGCLAYVGVGLVVGFFIGTGVSSQNRGYGYYGYGSSGGSWTDDFLERGWIGFLGRVLLYALLLGLSMNLLPASWPTTGGERRRWLRSASRILLGAGVVVMAAMVWMSLAGNWTNRVNSSDALTVVIIAGQVWPALALGLAAVHVFYAVRDFAVEIKAIAGRKGDPGESG